MSECYACMVGVATGPESHSEDCPARNIPMPKQDGQWGPEWDEYDRRVAKAMEMHKHGGIRYLAPGAGEPAPVDWVRRFRVASEVAEREGFPGVGDRLLEVAEWAQLSQVPHVVDAIGRALLGEDGGTTGNTHDQA